MPVLATSAASTQPMKAAAPKARSGCLKPLAIFIGVVMLIGLIGNIVDYARAPAAYNRRMASAELAENQRKAKEEQEGNRQELERKAQEYKKQREADVKEAARRNAEKPKTIAAAKPDLEVLEHHSESSEFARYVVGVVRNNSTHTYSYVQVSINLYDGSGAIVGSTLANMNSLEPSQKWKFKAIVTEESAVRSQIKDVTGY